MEEMMTKGAQHKIKTFKTIQSEVQSINKVA